MNARQVEYEQSRTAGSSACMIAKLAKQEAQTEVRAVSATCWKSSQLKPCEEVVEEAPAVAEAFCGCTCDAGGGVFPGAGAGTGSAGDSVCRT